MSWRFIYNKEGRYIRSNESKMKSKIIAVTLRMMILTNMSTTVEKMGNRRKNAAEEKVNLGVLRLK